MGNPFDEAGEDEEALGRPGGDDDLWLLESGKDEELAAEAKVEKKEEEEQEEEVLDGEGTEKRGEEAAFEAWIRGEKYHQMGD